MTPLYDLMLDAQGDLNQRIIVTLNTILDLPGHTDTSTTQFINNLADNIRNRGAMHTLISDGGAYELSKKVTDLLRSLFIADYQFEPYHQHQNKAED